MANNQSKYAWEDWQLTAYLLGELEPAEAAQIAAAAEQDLDLAGQLSALSKTLDDVKAVLGRDGTAAGDQAALAALEASVAGQVAQCEQPVATESQPQVMPAAAGYTWGRLVSRWENWASLAGLILVGVLLSQRTGRQEVAFADKVSPKDSVQQPTLSSTNRNTSTLDETVVREAWDQSKNAQLESLTQRLREDLSQEQGARRMASAPASASADRAVTSGPVVGDFAVGEGAAAAATSPAPADALENAPAPAAPTPATLAANLENARTFNYQLNPGYVAPGAVAPSGPQAGQQASAGAQLADNFSNMGGMGSGGGRGGMDSGFGSMEATGGALVPQPLAKSSRSESESKPHPQPMFDREEELRRRINLRQVDPHSGDRYASFTDNDFLKVDEQPLSTFSIDVDTASYSKVRQTLLEQRQLPPPAAVRIEEFINYFDYDYAGPKDDKPFAAALAVTSCPWQPKHQLVRIALQAKQVERTDRPKANLVFLLDVSGSMDEPNKLPLVKETMRLLTYQLTENDKVAMVVYAGAAGCVLESTYGHLQDQILAAIGRLNAGGSTNGGQGIKLAYKLARDNFIPGGINRVILCTDGDFNVGVTSTNDLVEMVKEQAQSNVFLTVLGYGNGNTNDAMMEQIADRGNGLYGFVDSRREAERQMVKQLTGNLMTVAKDVKIQVEFNPAKVRSYRLIGYENRQLAAEDFNNDKKDAGEIGAGHRVTAIYEVVPMNAQTEESQLIDGLRYQAAKRPEPVAPVKREEDSAVVNELLAVKLRYKQPEGSESQLLTFPLEDKSVPYAEIDKDFRWAAAMAEFGMLLRNSPHKGQANWSALSERARSAIGNPVDTARAETLEMINTASSMLR